MPIRTPKEITECRRFFLEPLHPKQRQYEALRRYFIDQRPSKEVAAEFGYTEGSFRVLCHHFRRDPDPAFFLTPVRGPPRASRRNPPRAPPSSGCASAITPCTKSPKRSRSKAHR